MTSKRDAIAEGSDSPAVDYTDLLRKAVQAPDAAFEEAVASGDAVAIACLGILQTAGGGSQLTRFKILLARHARSLAATRVLLAFVDLPDVVPSDVSSQVLELLRAQANDLPTEEREREQIKAVIRDTNQPDLLRRRMLYWLLVADRGAGESLSLEILDDPSQPPDSQLADRALRNLAESGKRKLQERAKRFALDQFTAPTDPSVPPRSPTTALAVIEHLASKGVIDVTFAQEVLADCAEQGIALDGRLERSLTSLRKDHLAALVEHITTAGHATWIVSQLMPELLAKAPELAGAMADAAWWPPECRMQIAGHPWQEEGDEWYVTVLRRLHETEDEAAKAQIRQRVTERCSSTAGTSPKEMPRLGARELLRLALSGHISPDEPALLQSLGRVPLEALLEDIGDLPWKQSQRAERLGRVVATFNPELIPALVPRAQASGQQTALAFLRGLTPSAIDQALQEVFDLVAGTAELLTAVSHASEAGANKALERWREQHDMRAFRALAGTIHDEARLADAPSAIRAYSRINHEERKELLAAMEPGTERVEVLVQILQDRSRPSGSRPGEDDLATALMLLGQQLNEGLDPDLLVEPISEICEKATQVSLRKAAYEALGHASPRQSVVDLLLRRRAEDTKPAFPTIEAALVRLADRLDHQAAQGTERDRAQAATLLARIDPARASQHARPLLSADEPEDRMAAAEILAMSGSPDLDVPLLKRQMEVEPSALARKALRRATLRLQIGDLAAAHERVGELAGIDDEEWHRIESSQLYGDWSDALVQALERVAGAEAQEAYGTAIDQLGEVAKILLFRAIDIAGDEVPLREEIRARAASNALDYGTALGMQQVQQAWPWVRFFASIHELRTEHVMPRGSTIPHDEPDERDWDTALNLFKRGAQGCLTLLRQKMG